MKKLLLSVCLLVATSFIASAQAVHSSFYIQNNLLGMGEGMEDLLDDMDSESNRLNGLSVGFNKAVPVIPSVPLFFEVGAGLTYALGKLYEEEDEYDCRSYYYEKFNSSYYEISCGGEFSMTQKIVSQHLMVNIPVNLMCKFQSSNSSITLEPYVGLNVKAHILGQLKYKLEYDACCDEIEDILEEVGEELEESDLNYFDKDDVGGKKYVAKRVNVGWQIGANVDFGKAFVGVSYGSDFGEFMEVYDEDWKFSATNITIGLRF